MATIIQTADGLTLRPWTLDDLEAFHAIWGDPQVITWGAAADRAASRAKMEQVIARCAGMRWPVAWHRATERTTGEVVGNICLQPAPWDTSEFEIGWHLRRDAWGRGHATTGARALIAEAVARLELPRIVCAILPSNHRSQRVATRLGFTRYARDFPHGGLPHDLLELQCR